MSDVGYMESNRHGDGKNLTWDDLRVATTDGWARPLTGAERDSLGRAWAAKNGWRLTDAEREQVARTWLREQIGGVETLRESVAVREAMFRIGSVDYLTSSNPIWRAAKAVLDALDGGQE